MSCDCDNKYMFKVGIDNETGKWAFIVGMEQEDGSIEPFFGRENFESEDYAAEMACSFIDGLLYKEGLQ